MSQRHSSKINHLVAGWNLCQAFSQALGAFASGCDFHLVRYRLAHSSTSPFSFSMSYCDLWYFVEGTDALGLVTINNSLAVFVLKGEIIKQLSNTYCNGVDAWQLEILKVFYPRILVAVPTSALKTSFRLT